MFGLLKVHKHEIFSPFFIELSLIATKTNGSVLLFDFELVLIIYVTVTLR
jgi:hypothetical protein